MAGSTWAAVAVAVAQMGTGAAAAAQDPASQVSIRLSNRTTAPESVLAAAQEVVSGVYRRAAVEVRWIRPADASPDLPLAIILAISTPVESTKSEAVLATAVQAQDGCGGLVYVLWPRVEAFARAERVPIEKVLGRVIAHEVGHLLLGQNSHSDSGIMRAYWRRGDLGGIDDRAVFSQAEAARIHAQLTACSGVQGCR